MRIASFDVGGTFIKYCVIENGEISQKRKVDTPRDTQEAFLRQIKKVLESMNNIDGIAFSMPGVIHVDKKYIAMGGSLLYNNHTDVKEWEKYFNLPIEIENDARCGAICEMKIGNMQGVKNGLVITFGTGVGGAIIINGSIHKGSHLIAGELSIIFAKDKLSHATGGTFGSIGSVYNLVSRIAQAKGIDTKDGKEIFQWIEENDSVATEIFEKYCYEVAQQLYNIQIVYDPEKICVGGGASENPIYLNGLKKAYEEYYKTFPFKFPHAELDKCKYNNDANLLGAYYHYIERHKEH